MPDIHMAASSNVVSSTNGYNKSWRFPTANRKPFMCTECHKNFRRAEELYEHTEYCVLEAFENEVDSAFADMPFLRDARPTLLTQSGISIKAESLPKLCSEVIKTTVDNGTAIRDAYKQNIQSLNCLAVDTDCTHYESSSSPCMYETQKSDACNRPLSTIVEVGNSRTVENSDGLKLVISVEKSVNHSNELLNDGNVETTSDYIEEDVALPDSLIFSTIEPNSNGKVIGALANADDDLYRPKMECPTCGLVLYRHNFSTHYRIHTGELPFECNYCTKRFRTTSALKVHLRAHTGEKPYICPKCNYSCTTKRNLDRHIINNHIREGERRGPRQRKSRYRNDSDEEYFLANGTTVEECENIDHRYIILPNHEVVSNESSSFD